MLILRRQASQKLGLADDTTKAKLELEELQGVNTAIAEKFAEVGVTTTLQLAYEDPILLTMRTNLSFSFVTDVISQSLATIYGLNLNVARHSSVRGAMEAAELFEDLHSKKAERREGAEAALADLAKVLRTPIPVVRRILNDVKDDPYTTFLRNVWC